MEDTLTTYIRSRTATQNSEYAPDVDSHQLPSEFKCFECTELLKNNIYQCVQGHTLCLSCCLELTNLQCSICHSSFTDINGHFIRNTELENLMDNLIFTCPYKRNGCQQTLHRYDDVTEHVSTCIYADRIKFHLCYYLSFPVPCNNPSNSVEPSTVLRHLLTYHKLCTHYGDSLELNYSNFLNELLSEFATSIHQRPILPCRYCNPIHVCVNEKHFLLMFQVNQQKRCLWFHAIMISNHNHENHELIIEIGPATKTMQPFTCKQPVCSLTQAPGTIENASLAFSIPIISKFYIQPNGTFKVKVKIV